MTNPETEEKIRKLVPIDPKKADASWLFYLSGEGDERQLADNLIDVLLFQKIQKNYREQIFLEPPSVSNCHGDYVLGTVM